MRKKLIWITGLIITIGIGASCTSKKESSSLQAQERVVSSTVEEELSGMSYFSLSPDGTWLFYPKNHRPIDAKYGLYDIKNLRQYDITVDAKTLVIAESNDIFIRRYGCWNASGNRVYIVGTTPYEPYFFVNIDRNSTNFSLSYAEDLGPEEKHFYSKCRDNNHLVNTFFIQKPSKRRALLVEVGNPNRVIASHTPNSFVHNQIDIRDMSLSPDQRYLAYGVSESLGSFVTPSDLYIVDLKSNQKPVFLSGRVSAPFVWSPDSDYIYIYSWKNIDQGVSREITRWSMKKLFPDE